MIVIKKSSTADTRSCDVSKVSKEQLKRSTIQHKTDICTAIEFIVSKLRENAHWHDWDKLDDLDTFYSDFQRNFQTHDWWDNHKKIQKHHINKECIHYEDINLLDILEHIVDCCMAGLGRTGTVYPLVIDPELLQKAVVNTVDLLVRNTKVEDQ